MLTVFLVGLIGASKQPSYNENALVSVKEADKDVMKGSGFVYGSEGYMITNNHVAVSKNGSETDLEVRFNQSGEWVEVVTVGRNPEADLAILKIEHLPDGVETLQPSNIILEKGQEVEVLGSSPKRGERVLTGKVVDVSEDIRTREGVRLKDALVISAPIELGNSGGPVLISKREFVGVISARNEDEELGFAIPASSVRDTVNQIIGDQNAKVN